MQRNILEGVDWTGQRELLQEKVSKLFRSYLDSRFYFFYMHVSERTVTPEDFVSTLFYSHHIFPEYFLQNLVMQHVDHSAGDLIHLLQGLLRYDPLDRLTARAALRHTFFARDHLRML